MSKSLGNVVDPWDVFERQGADALRWYLVTNGSPWAPRRVGMAILDDVVRRFLLTLWNVYTFFVTYANASGYDPSTTPAVPHAERPPLDRWALSQLEHTVRTARSGLESYDATSAGRRIATFVDDLSNWYVRRARRRFWDPGGAGGAGASGAFHTLYECLLTLSHLLAPLTPFVAEELWRNLGAGRGGAVDSIHLRDYPVPDAGRADLALDEAMAAARGIVELGRRVRTEARVRVRQPLLEAVVHHGGDHAALGPLLDLVAEELNVKRIVFADSAEQLGRWRAKPNYRVLGRRLGPQVKEVAQALARDDGSLAASLARGESVSVAAGSGEPVRLTEADVELQQETLEGWGVAGEGGLTVALELELTDELRTEGLGRELVRLVQDARKAAGLEVSDRIALGIATTGAPGAALEAYADTIAGETLAIDLRTSELEDATYREDAELDGVAVTLTLRKA